MNQLVAPTSFITSTSRRRAKIDRRIVLAISAIEASTSSTARPAVSPFTRPVAERILLVSSSRLRTSSMAASCGSPPVGFSALRRSASILSGSSGVTRKESGSGFEPSSSAPCLKASGFLPCARRSASAFEMYSTDLTFAVFSSASRSSALLLRVAASLM